MNSASILPNFSAGSYEPILSHSAKYRKYSSTVKDEVARTKNVYLFPDLNIPRTTAQYWVKKQKPSGTADVIEIESVYRKKSEFLEAELEKERAMRRLLEVVRKVFPYDFRAKHLKNKISRAQIVASIQECTQFHKLSHCLDAIGLSKSAYRRWASEISPCDKRKNPCDRRRALQLTEDELSTMKRFITSKRYGHISVASLHLLAQRAGELFCSVETWYKYIKIFEWKRPWAKIKRDFKKLGIRSSRPNEIWHIDVTEVCAGLGIKFYIQAVIDNYSRFVMAWNIVEQVTAKTTVETLSMARKKASELLDEQSPSSVMMDPGKENKNNAVQSFIISQNLTRILAQVDVHYSNSMIEGLFHGLNRYLYHQKVKCFEDLVRKVNFYFKQHNEVVPLAVLKGGRPKEVFLSKWGEAELTELSRNKTQAFLDRKQKNLQPPCASCPL